MQHGFWHKRCVPTGQLSSKPATITVHSVLDDNGDRTMDERELLCDKLRAHAPFESHLPDSAEDDGGPFVCRAVDLLNWLLIPSTRDYPSLLELNKQIGGTEH